MTEIYQDALFQIEIKDKEDERCAAINMVKYLQTQSVLKELEHVYAVSLLESENVILSNEV